MATITFTSAATQAEASLPEKGNVTGVTVNGASWAYRQNGAADLTIDFAPALPAGRTVIITYNPVATDPVATVVIADNVSTQDPAQVLSAKQGYVLKGLVDTATSTASGAATAATNAQTAAGTAATAAATAQTQANTARTETASLLAALNALTTRVAALEAGSGTPAKPVFSAQSAPAGTVGVPYSYQFAASGSPTFALGTGSLPAGLTLVNGLLSGTPTTAATSTFTVDATNGGGTQASTSQSVVISAAAPTGTVFADAPSVNPLSISGSSVTVTWTPPLYNGDHQADAPSYADPTGYRLYLGDTPFEQREGGSYTTASSVLGRTTFTYTFTGVASGTHRIAVATQNNAGIGPSSTEIVFTILQEA